MKKLRIHILLDRSGSMESIREDVIGGINAYVEELKRSKSKGTVSLTIFDSKSVDTIRDDVKISKFNPIVSDEYFPRAMTPLYDAIGIVIGKLEKGYNKKKHLPSLVIMTDGLENHSKEHTAESIKKILKKKQKKEDWLITYLGADHDAFTQSKTIGISQSNTIVGDKKLMGAVMSSYAGNTIARGLSGDAASAAWSDEQRKKAKHSKYNT